MRLFRRRGYRPSWVTKEMEAAERAIPFTVRRRADGVVVSSRTPRSLAELKEFDRLGRR